MYGLRSSSTAASTAGVAALPFDSVWLVFAAVTIFFAGTALFQLVRRSKNHRP